MAAMSELDDPLMPIGLFSRSSLVSVKALRLYHEQGLLIPAAIDRATGYRSYRVSQLADAQVIKRLRDLDVPLRDVARIVASRDPAVTREVIARHEATMREQLAAMTRIIDDLQLSVAYPSLQTPVHIRTEPAMHALAITGNVLDPGHLTFGAFLGRAYGDLSTTLQRLGVPPAGPDGALYPPEVGAEQETVTAYIPVGHPVVLDEAAERCGVVNLMIPEVTAAVMSHAGSYAEIDATYRQLGAWVARHARSADLPVREVYLVSDDDLRTEIVWPVITP